MPRKTNFSTQELVGHVLVYSMSFTLLAIEAVYGAVVSSLVSRSIQSRFILGVLIAVEHVMVVVDAVYITSRIVRDAWHKLEGLFNED